jgi:hypothetical protein
MAATVPAPFRWHSDVYRAVAGARGTSQGTMVNVPHPEEEPLGFFDFINRRRRVISDRTWFGLAFIAGSFALPSWWQVLLLLPGAALVTLGLRRALARQDPATGQHKPGPPW